MIEQAQRGESIYWATYEQTLELEIEFALKELAPPDLEELWRATESSLDYEFDFRWFKEHSDLPQEENPPPKKPYLDQQLDGVAMWIHDEVLSTAQVSDLDRAIRRGKRRPVRISPTNWMPPTPKNPRD